MLFLDTDIIVDVTRKHPPAIAWLNANASETMAASGFSLLELLAGTRSATEQQRVEREVGQFQIIWLSAPGCDAAVQTYRRLRLSHGIGVFDTLIAATAVELNVPLHTFNIKHFQHVPGLTTI